MLKHRDSESIDSRHCVLLFCLLDKPMQMLLPLQLSSVLQSGTCSTLPGDSAQSTQLCVPWVHLPLSVHTSLLTQSVHFLSSALLHTPFPHPLFNLLGRRAFLQS